MKPPSLLSFEAVVGHSDPGIYDIRSSAPGPEGSLPLTDDMLRESPSGDLFALSQNVGMGWSPDALNRRQYLILSTQGGIRASDGTPVALGFHTGHWEVGLLMQAAAEELTALGGIPFGGYCTDPCDGRTQGTPGMMDSLPYRNDAAIVFRRLIRSLPTRRGVIGVATCDKGLPAMMIALAATHDLPCVLVPGGVTLPAEEGEDAGKIQSIGARYAHGEITLEYAADMGCRTCASPGGGCQFLGTAATSQVVGEAFGLSLPHSALAPSGQAVWTDMARRSARALMRLDAEGQSVKRILTEEALENAMTVHAAFGGSTNLLLHIPAIAHAAGLRRPSVEDWERINRRTPRLVDVLPNGPAGYPTVIAFLAGGVPEVMLHLREAGLLNEKALTAAGTTLGQVLDWWRTSDRRRLVRERLKKVDGIDPDDVIMSPERARNRGLTSTVTFPRGNLAPEGSVITRERDAIAAIKSRDEDGINPGDLLILICRGPMGAGMEETYQITAALRHLSFGKHVSVVTDARFSGISTGACIGHVGPEALAGGPIGKLADGDLVEIVIDRNNLTGSINLVGTGDRTFGAEEGTRLLTERPPRPDLAGDPNLPDDTRLWAALQQAGGGAWGGCVYDVNEIVRRMRYGEQEEAQAPPRKTAASPGQPRPKTKAGKNGR